jgi:nucleotide-binding universal stress UspA family protein
MPNLFGRILVPHDFSDAAGHALRIAVGLARQHRGRLTVLHVVPPYPVVGFPEPVTAVATEEQILASTKRRLEELVRRQVRGRGAPPVRTHVVSGDPYTRIVAAAELATMLVMATEGRTGLSHLLIGSVTEKVVRHSTKPVLTLRPPTRARRGSGEARSRSRRRS